VCLRLFAQSKCTHDLCVFTSDEHTGGTTPIRELATIGMAGLEISLRGLNSTRDSTPCCLIIHLVLCVESERASAVSARAGNSDVILYFHCSRQMSTKSTSLIQIYGAGGVSVVGGSDKAIDRGRQLESFLKLFALQPS
jgi:hypothetical protein